MSHSVIIVIISFDIVIVNFDLPYRLPSHEMARRTAEM